MEELKSNKYIKENQFTQDDLVDLDNDDYLLNKDSLVSKIIEPKKLSEALSAEEVGLLDDEYFDDIDRCKNSNRLIEAIVSTMAHISILGQSH